MTLTGPGGVGKTRLAIRVVEDLATEFPQEAWFVSLAPVRDATLVAAAIAATIGATGPSGIPAEEQISVFLGDQRALIVLDNLEHLPLTGPLAANLLGACPALTILTTSRAVLGVSGEHVVSIPPLELPQSDWSIHGNETDFPGAVRLFLERARAAQGEFIVTEENAAAIAAVCRKLDGLPLAIELAAARSRVLTPAALLDRLNRSLSVLVGGPKDQPARLRTMRDAIAWSYDLLPPAEQALFRRLAVFVGGFDLEAVESIAPRPLAGAPSVLDGVATLIDQSLLYRVDGSDDPRFAMLETVREFGLEQLVACAEEPVARDAHAAWCRALAERCGPHLNGPDQHIWVARLETDLGNVRAALGWLREQGDAEGALRLANAICWFWTMPGRFHEARDLFRELIALPGAEQAPDALAWALNTAADLANWLDDQEQAMDLYQRSLVLYRTIGDRDNLTMVLRGIGSVLIDRGDPARSRELLAEALEHARASGAAWEIAAITNMLGLAAFALGDSDAAIDYHIQALADWRLQGDTGYIASALTNIGLVSLAAGRLTRAEEAFRESLDLASAEADRLNLIRSVEGFGALASARGDLPRAARLLAAAEAQFSVFGISRRPAARATIERVTADLRSCLDEPVLAFHWQSGQALPLEAAVAEARLMAEELAGASDALHLPPVPALTEPLTRRELEVLPLLCEGLTDRQVAARLFISTRTASNHVSSILAKLGVATRTAAASEAQRHGLVKATARPANTPAASTRENE